MIQKFESVPRGESSVMSKAHDSAKWSPEIAHAKALLRTKLLTITKAIDACDQASITSLMTRTQVSGLYIELDGILAEAEAKAADLAKLLAKAGAK